MLSFGHFLVMVSAPSQPARMAGELYCVSLNTALSVSIMSTSRQTAHCRPTLGLQTLESVRYSATTTGLKMLDARRCFTIVTSHACAVTAYRCGDNGNSTLYTCMRTWLGLRHAHRTAVNRREPASSVNSAFRSPIILYNHANRK